MRGLAASHRLPDITRPDVSLVVVSECPAVRPDRQRATAELLLASWERLPWPSDLLSLSAFSSSDGETVLSYAQWKSAAPAPELTRTCGALPWRGMDPAPRGLELAGPVAYRLHGSAVRERVIAPGCIVVVSLALDRPSGSRQRQWIEALFDATVADPDPPAGRISGHFHLGADGVHMLVYTEWTSEEAHREATLRPEPLALGLEWHRGQALTGLATVRLKRYHLLRSLALAF